MGEIRKSAKQRRTVVKKGHRAQVLHLPQPILSSESLLALWGCRNTAPSTGFSTERQRPLLPRRICCRSWLWLLWTPQESARQTSRLVPTVALVAHEKAELQGPGQTSAPPDFELQLQCKVLYFETQNLGLWTLLKVQDAFQVLLLPRVYLPSAKQAGSSQHTGFQLTLTWVSTAIPCAREPEKHHNLQHLTKAPASFSLSSTS